MKPFLLLLAFTCLLAGKVSAQQSYALTTELPLEEISGTGTAVTLDAATSSAALPIGFDFNFWENTYSTFYINPNGTLSFENPSVIKMSAAYNNQKLGSSTDIHNFIAFAWQYGTYDFTNATINYFTTANSPNRILVVNYKGVAINQTASATYPNAGQGLIDVQIQLFEGTNGKIQIHNTTNRTVGGTGSASGPGQMGVENKDGDLFREASDYAIVYAYNPNAGFYVPTPRYYYDFSGEAVEFRRCTPPSIPLISASNSTICSARPSVTLNASGADGAQYMWETGQVGAQISVSTEGSYRAKALMDGCQSTYSDYVQISSLSYAPTISSNVSTVSCYQTATLTSSYLGPGIYTWANGTDVLQSTSSYQYHVQNQQSTTDYYVTYSADGCSSPVSSKRTISGGCISPPSIEVSGSYFICSGATVALDAVGCPSPGVVTWSEATTGILGTGLHFETSTLDADNVNKASKNYAFRATCTVNGVASGASNTETVTANYVPDTPTDAYSNLNNVAPNTNVTLTATGNASFGYKWTWNNGANTSTTNPMQVVVPATTDFYVTQTNGTCISQSRQVTVHVAGTPTVTVNNTQTEYCGAKGTQVVVNFTTTGTFSNPNFTVKLVRTSSQCSAPNQLDVVTASTSSLTATLTIPTTILQTASNNCSAPTVSYKIVVVNNGNGIPSSDYPITIYQPVAGTVTATGLSSVTAPGQVIHMNATAVSGTTKTWYGHSETQYWQSGSYLGLTADAVDVSPETSTYYSVVYTDAHSCFARSSRIRIPFNLTISGTNTGADLVYAEGRGVHLDAGGIVSGTGSPYPQFYAPPGADADTKVYSTVFDTSYPTSWTGYFIIRKSDYWEIYSGSGPMYSPPSYTRLFHTKNAFPTSNSGGRMAARTSAITGTRPPENAVWIKDADNSELTLTLTGVSEDYSALPVTLTYFNAKLNEQKKVALIWETASEQNSDYFDIERSADLKSFALIGKVKAKENKSDKTHYQLTDENPIPGIGYYRLKQVDLDGTSHYYRVLSIRTEGTDAPYPNPSNGKFLNLDVPATSNIFILNLKGESISFDRKKLSDGSVQILPKTNLSPGLYLITVNGVSRKWVVQ